jgi:hypothetical protein
MTGEMMAMLNVLLVLAAYTLIGLVAGRTVKQLEFNGNVEVLESCSECLSRTQRNLELSWCRTHKPADSAAVPVGIFWIVALIVGLFYGIGLGIKRILFPAGKVRSKRADLLLRELKLKREEVLVEQRQAEIEEQHKALGIFCQDNFPTQGENDARLSG